MIIQSHKNKNKRMTPEDIVVMRYHMKQAGIEPYNNKSIVRTALGVSMVVVGIVTTPIPCTTIPLCVGGCVLIGYDLRTLIRRIEYESHRMRIVLQNRLKSMKSLKLMGLSV